MITVRLKINYTKCLIQSDNIAEPKTKTERKHFIHSSDIVDKISVRDRVTPAAQ